MCVDGYKLAKQHKDVIPRCLQVILRTMLTRGRLEVSHCLLIKCEWQGGTSLCVTFFKSLYANVSIPLAWPPLLRHIVVGGTGKAGEVVHAELRHVRWNIIT